MLNLVYSLESKQHDYSLSCKCQPVLVVDPDEYDVRLFHRRLWRQEYKMRLS